MREFLERNYKEEMDREETIKLTVKSLLEVVQTGAKNIEIAIMAPGKPIEVIKPHTLQYNWLHKRHALTSISLLDDASRGD